jgi:hypothetical protein
MLGDGGPDAAWLKDSFNTPSTSTSSSGSSTHGAAPGADAPGAHAPPIAADDGAHAHAHAPSAADAADHVNNLPTGILHGVFGHLGPRDLCAVTATCQLWRALNRDAAANCICACQRARVVVCVWGGGACLWCGARLHEQHSPCMRPATPPPTHVTHDPASPNRAQLLHLALGVHGHRRRRHGVLAVQVRQQDEAGAADAARSGVWWCSVNAPIDQLWQSTAIPSCCGAARAKGMAGCRARRRTRPLATHALLSVPFSHTHARAHTHTHTYAHTHTHTHTHTPGQVLGGQVRV